MHSNYRVSGSKAYSTPLFPFPAVVLRSEEEGVGVCQLNVHMLSRERESLARGIINFLLLISIFTFGMFDSIF
jgi:hypothetical protein